MGMSKLTNKLLCTVGVLGALFGVAKLLTIQRPVEKPNSKDYETKSVVAYVPGFSTPVSIVDVDKDGRVDGIITDARSNHAQRIAYFAPGYEKKIQNGHFRKGYSLEMTPEMREQTQSAFDGVNGLGLKIHEERYEKGQEKLEEKSVNPQTLQTEGEPINPLRIR